MKAVVMKHSLFNKVSKTASVIAFAICTNQAIATPNIPPPKQTLPILITGATLHTVGGDVIENGRMWIEQGKILRIGKADSIADQPDVTKAQTISLAGKHVYPGLISANTVLGLVEVQAVRATVDTAEIGAINPNSRALVAVNPDSEMFPVARANGVLAALSTPRPSAGSLINGTSALLQLDGWTWEDMGLIPEAGLHVSLPSLRSSAALYPNLPSTRLEEMQRITTQRIKSLEDAFEAAQVYNKARMADPSTIIDSRWEAMRSVFGGKRQVFIDAEELPQIRYALNFAERFNLKIVIVGGMDAWRIADVLRERQVPVVIGGVHRLPLRRGESNDTPFKLASRLSEAGVKFCIGRGGTTNDAPSERSLPYEAGTAAAYGLPRAEALKAITLYPAQILGAADKLGSLEVGKLASFIVTDGDPLDIRTKVEKIFIQGRDIPLTDRQTKLNEKYEQKYQQLKLKP
jgi:imidazolonepropionase-like amidohydrolase